jgi:hypothetical protein
MTMRWRCAGAGLLLAAPAWAGVITVDDSGGADFTSLPEAVAAAAPGDTLLVHAGNYAAFTIDGKPLTILGLVPGQVLVGSESSVRNVAAPSMVVLCQLDFWRLSLWDSTGPIVLDGLRVYGTSSSILRVQTCADVRAIASHVESNFMNSGGYSTERCAAMISQGSRFEAAESLLVGHQLTVDLMEGWEAVRVRGGSRVFAAATSVTGGLGGDDFCFSVCCKGYFGGAAFMVEEVSSLRISGLATDVIKSGKTGQMWCGGVPTQWCPIKVFGVGSVATRSGVTVIGAGSSTCIQNGGVSSLAPSPDPLLERVLVPQAGGTLQFHVRGEPDDVVTLFLGRSAVVVPLPGVAVEQLTSEERNFELGLLTPTGVVTFSMPTPPSLPKGFTFFAQARIDRLGSEFRTNSVPIVLR